NYNSSLHIDENNSKTSVNDFNDLNIQHNNQEGELDLKTKYNEDIELSYSLAENLPFESWNKVD
ncbi:12329_t:CDS:1, partial [Dentiscutata heterogama]